MLALARLRLFPGRSPSADGVWRAKKGEVLSKIFALPWPPPCCLPPVTSACCQCLRWSAWGPALLFRLRRCPEEPRSARLAAVRVSFQHPGHAQCKWWDMESTHSAGGGSRSSTSGGAVGSSANGGAAHGGEHTVQLRTQTQNLRSTHDFRAEFGKVHGIFLHRWIALDLSF